MHVFNKKQLDLIEELASAADALSDAAFQAIHQNTTENLESLSEGLVEFKTAKFKLHQANCERWSYEHH